MTYDPKRILAKQQDEIDKLNNQRHWWLKASSFVFIAVTFLIIGWDWIDHFNSKELWWFITSCMLIVTVNWWYWTMRGIRLIITHRITEYTVLTSLLKDIEALKHDIKQFKHNNIDLLRK